MPLVIAEDMLPVAGQGDVSGSGVEKVDKLAVSGIGGDYLLLAFFLPVGIVAVSYI